MNSSEIIWLIVGTAAGYLLGTLATVYLLRIRVREVKKLHPMAYVMATGPGVTLTPHVPTPPAPENDDLGWASVATTTWNNADVDWDTAVQEELVVEPPKRRYGPVPTTVTEPCPICGKPYKQGVGMRQHTRLKHPAKYRKPAPRSRRKATVK